MSELDLQDATLHVHVDDLGNNLTIRFKSSEEGTDNPFKRFSVNNGLLEFLQVDHSVCRFDDVEILLHKTDNIIAWSLSQASSADEQNLTADGNIDLESGKIDLTLKADNSLKLHSLELPFQDKGHTVHAAAEGLLNLDFTIDGAWNDIPSLYPRGSIDLKQWTIDLNDNPVCHNLSLRMTAVDGYLDCDFDSTDCLEGDIHADLTASLPSLDNLAYSGVVVLSDIAMEQLQHHLHNDRFSKTGSVSLGYLFHNDAFNLKTLEGDGFLSLKHTELRKLPDMADLSREMGVADIGPASGDTAVAFSNEGFQVEIASALLASSVIALRIEPGGAIDLQSGDIDLYMIGAPLNRLEKALSATIPFLDAVKNLKDKLIRLRIKGNWSQPSSELIKKEPVRDLSEGTIGFVMDVVKTPKNIGEKIFNTAKSIFESKKD